MSDPAEPPAPDSDGTVSLVLTLKFDPPVSAEDFRDRFRTLADAMDDVQEDEDA